MEELLDVVNTRNRVVGCASKREVYSRKLAHRIVHVLILHPRTQGVFLQKRSATKEDYANCFATSACGHVRSGETYEHAARRELEEELGIKVPLRKAAELKLSHRESKTFVELYYGFAESGFSFEPNEVSGGSFFSIRKALELAKTNDAHPQLLPCLRWLESNANKLESLWARSETLSFQ